MPSVSKSQQQAAGAALAAQKGEIPKSGLYGASKQMAKMSMADLRKFAKTKHTGLPREKALLGTNNQGMTNSVGYPTPKACMSLEDTGRTIVDRLLGEDSLVFEDDEQAEIETAKTILSAVNRLQTSLAQATPEQQHDITTIRAAANSLIRTHEPQKVYGPQGSDEQLGKSFFNALEPPPQHGWGE